MLQPQLAAYPVLLPVYMMRYDLNLLAVPDKVALVCIIQAHSKYVRETLPSSFINLH